MPLEDILTLTIPSPLGPLRIRREGAGDDAFRFALFCQGRPELAALPLPPPVKEQLLRQQFQAQTAGYATRYPDALLAIIEHDGAPVGRLALADALGTLHIADVAVSASLHGMGLGSAVLAALHRAARPLRLHVSITNQNAMRLYQRLGFVLVAQTDTVLEMEWA
jgi:ribosomal protein S18 acetylase RimI-like enzyme